MANSTLAMDKGVKKALKGDGVHRVDAGLHQDKSGRIAVATGAKPKDAARRGVYHRGGGKEGDVGQFLG